VFDFKDKIIAVTGAARGIGRNMALAFARHKGKVLLIDNNRAAVEEEAAAFKRMGLSVEPVVFDLADIEKINSFVKHLFNDFGRIDILINNARAGSRTPPFSEDPVNLDLALDVTLKAPLFFSQAMIREKKESKTFSGTDQSIINISSVVALNICRESVGYHLAKASLENLTKYLAVHGGPHGVRVNAIRPGFIVQDEHIERYEREDNKDYRETSRFCHPLRRIGRSDDVANAALFLCSDLAGFITGQILTVDGGLTIQDQWDLVHTYYQSCRD
jgi:NAD(P)-dependent dehydrogenase (short-subunit alcohol dehydrogenase family)